MNKSNCITVLNNCKMTTHFYLFILYPFIQTSSSLLISVFIVFLFFTFDEIKFKDQDTF